MTVAGRKPKDPEVRRNRVPLQHDWTDVEDVPFDGGPRLPRTTPNGLPWPSATKKWWAVVAAMPHCRLWDDADWQFALDTAFVKAAFHMGMYEKATELRQREAVLGTTVDSRRDLRIRYVPVVTEETSEEPPPDIANLNDRRRRLMEVAGAD